LYGFCMEFRMKKDSTLKTYFVNSPCIGFSDSFCKQMDFRAFLLKIQNILSKESIKLTSAKQY
jgi:hypothetical protein